MTLPVRMLLYVVMILMLGVVHPRLALAQDRTAPDRVTTAALASSSSSTSAAPTKPGCGHWGSVGAAAVAGAAVWAQAGPEPERIEAPRVWVTPGAASWHADRSRGYNEIHPGLGVEVALVPAWRLAAGAYCNSEHRTSAYAAAVWVPWQVHELVRVGIAAGVASGYMSAAGTERAVLRAGPAIVVEGDRWGLNITGAPSVGNLDGFVAVQLKLRLL